MKIIQPKAEILRPYPTQEAVEAIYKLIAQCGGVSYLNTKELTSEYIRKFIKDRIREGHFSVLEHAVMTVSFTIDRGISHELVRHRLASFTQESTRYCNYGKDKFDNDVTVIEPLFYKDIPTERKEEIQRYFTEQFKRPLGLNGIESRYADWFYSCWVACETYIEMLRYGATPQEARNVLPTSTKTVVNMTANLREWRHVFNLRAAGTTGKPHPQIEQVMIPLLNQCKELMPEIFEDIGVKQ